MYGIKALSLYEYMIDKCLATTAQENVIIRCPSGWRYHLWSEPVDIDVVHAVRQQDHDVVGVRAVAASLRKQLVIRQTQAVRNVCCA